MTEDFNNKPRIFKTAFVFNTLTLTITAVVFVVSFLMIGKEAEVSKRYFYELSSLITFVLTVFNFIMLRSFLKNTKFSKLYFMLVSVFFFYPAMVFAEKGFLIMLFLLISLFVNIKCYSKIHPKDN